MNCRICGKLISENYGGDKCPHCGGHIPLTDVLHPPESVKVQNNIDIDKKPDEVESDVVSIDDPDHPANIQDAICEFLGIDIGKEPYPTRVELVMEPLQPPMIKVEYALKSKDLMWSAQKEFKLVPKGQNES